MDSMLCPGLGDQLYNIKPPRMKSQEITVREKKPLRNGETEAFPRSFKNEI